MPIIVCRNRQIKVRPTLPTGFAGFFRPGIRPAGGRSAGGVAGIRMQIHVITLPDAVARQRQATSQLADAGLEFLLFPAVVGQEAVKASAGKVQEHKFLLTTGRQITPGEIGCFSSHRQLWELCVQVGEPVLVMEDDFQLSADFPAALALLEQKIADYGFIRLQTERRANKKLVETHDRFKLWRYTKAPNSAMCYGLSPAAAARLLAHADSITAPVDVYMKRFWEHGQEMYGITPYTVTESELSSASQIAGRSKAKKGLATRLHRTYGRLCDLVARAYYNHRPMNGDRS